MRAQDVFSLDGQVALVTGAGSGLGRRFAAVLAANGARVIVSDIDETSAKATAAAILSQGGQATAIAIDVTSAASIAAGLRAGELAFGRVDVLVNNAGVLSKGRAITLAESEWRRVFDVNLDGAWRVAQQVAARMIEGDGGVIVNIASVLGVGTGKGVLPYTVAKAGLVQMTRALALEWAPAGIRVNALAPGYVATQLNRDFTAAKSGEGLRRRIPQRRFGSESDLDGALLLLASSASAFMTGSIIIVDGGQMLTA